MLARPLTVLALALGLLAPAAPGLASDPPDPPDPSAPAVSSPLPAYGLQPVSGGYPDEQYTASDVVDVSADGRHVLYAAGLPGARPGLLLRDRTAGTTRLVDHLAGDPSAPAGLFDTARGVLSADGGTVAWVSADGGVVADDAPVARDAFAYDLSGDGAVRVPRSAEAGELPADSVAVSGDGTRVAVLRGDRYGWPQTFRLEVVDLATDGVVASRALPSWGSAVALSRDGGTVAWVESHDTGEVDEGGEPLTAPFVVVADAATLTPDVELPAHFSSAPTLEADGSSVAYSGPEQEPLVADLTGQDAARTQVPVPDGVLADRVRMSGDGSTVVYTDAEQDSSGPSRVWSVTLPDGAPVLVAGSAEEPEEGAEAPLGRQATTPAPSHDGSVVALWLDDAVVAAVRSGPEADTRAPVWPAGAALAAEPVSRTAVRLSWPAATDDRQVVGYEVLAGGAPLLTVPGSRTGSEVAVPDGRAAEPVEYAVRALDAAGNASPDLTATARAGAELTVERDAHDALLARWEAAAVPGLTHYRVLRANGGQSANGPATDDAAWQALPDVPAGTTELRAADLPALTWFDVRVDLVLADGSTRPWATRTSARTDLPPVAPLALDEATATSVRLAWPALPASAPVEHYRLERRAQDATTWSPVGTRAPGEDTSLVDDGLAPRTAYVWRVVAVLRGGWPERVVTTEVSASTGSEGVTATLVDAPRTPDGSALALGSDLVGTASGAPGMTGEVRLWSTAGHDGPPEVVLPMTEPAPGSYTTAPYRLDGTLPAVTWAEVVLRDGERTHVRGAAVAPVSGRLELDVLASPDDLTGLELRLGGPRAVPAVPVTAPGRAAVPLPAGTWNVLLVAADGTLVASRTNVRVDAATVVPLELAPARPAELDVRLTAAGDAPLAAGTLTVTGADGAVLATRRLLPQAPSVLLRELAPRTRVRLSFALEDPGLRLLQPVLEVDLPTGRTVVELPLLPMPTAEAAVTVTGAGVPLPGAAVALSQVVDGRTFTSRATADGDGRAVVAALQGEGAVRAEAPFHAPAGKPVALDGRTATPVALELTRTPTYRIRPHLIVVGADGSEVEQPLDWRTATHFGVRLTLGSGATATGRTVSQVIAYDGPAGTRVELCADGSQSMLPAGCTSTVLGTDVDVDLTVRLEQAGAATAALVDEQDRPLQGWYATVHKAGTDGQLRYVGRRSGTGSSPVLGFASPGLHVVQWSDPTGRAGSSDVVVVAGQTTSLGRVVVTAATAAPDGVSTQALPSPVLAGGLLVVRIGLPTSPVDRTALRLRLPAGATATPGTATVEGRPAPSRIEDGTVVLPLTGRGAVTVRIPMTVASDVPDGELVALASLTTADRAVQDLGPVAAQVRRLSIEGPDTTAGAFTVRGHAPAGATVVVRDEARRELATATAGAGGRWWARVQLPAPRQGVTSQLVAVTSTAAGEHLSEPVHVRFHTDGIEATSITIDNSLADARGRSVTWDPRVGNAAPTLVYVPGAPMVLTARFPDATRVRDFTAYVGELEATGTCAEEECTATFPPSAAREVGDIALGYHVAALPWEPLSVGEPTLEELTALVPSPWNDPQEVDFDLADPDDWTGSWRVGDVPLSVRTTMGPSRELGPPSPEDAEMSLRLGAPLRDVSVSVRETGGQTEVVVRGEIATAWLEGSSPGLTADSPDQKAFKTFEKVVKVGMALKDLADIYRTGANSEVLDELSAEVDLVIRPCNPEIADSLDADIADARGTLVFHRLALNAFDWLSVAGLSWASLAGVPSGGTAKGFNLGVKELMKQGVDYLGDEFVERAQTAVAKAGATDCEGGLKHVPIDHDWKKPVGKPTWIFDPSGYVYEALGTQRLEGVTATVLSGPGPDGPWTPWDADAFGQTNPQTTTADGRYGWDVPQGWWKVRYEKPGYRPAESAALQVLPEHYGVDVDLHRLAAPALSTASFTGAGALEVVFDQWMSVPSVTAGLTVTAAGAPVAGTLEPVEPQDSPTGLALARRFRFVPETAFGSGQAVQLHLPATTVDHGGVPLEQAVTRALTTPATELPVCPGLRLQLTPPQGKPGHTVKARVQGAPGQTVRLLTQVGTGAPALAGTAVTDRNGAATFSVEVRATTRFTAEQVGCGRSAAVVLEVK